MRLVHKLTSVLKNPQLNPTTAAGAALQAYSTNRTNKNGADQWNDAWETAWLPDDLSGKSPRAPWESDVTFSLPSTDQNAQTSLSSKTEEIDPETQAFVEEMNDNWDQRKGKSVKKDSDKSAGPSGSSSSLYSLENIKRDYRLTKQKIHAGLWVKEIEKLEEAKLGNSISGGDDIEKLLDSASEIFDSPNNDLGNTKISGSEFKNKPDGWETTSKAPDGSLWDMSQREEDILVQEFERRINFNKFQIESFIRTHIFSRRRPIDGWKYMIEEIGPNAKKGKGSVSRLASVSDESTQPFREEKTTFVKGCWDFLRKSKDNRQKEVGIWLMRDRGKAESWSKLLSVAQVDVNWSRVNVKPITSSESGKQVLLEKDSEQLLWYDLEKKSVKKIRMLNGPRTFDAILYLESLAQLNGGGDDGVVRKTGYPEDKRRQNKKREDFLSKGFKLKL